MPETKSRRPQVIREELHKEGSLPHILVNTSPHFMGVIEPPDFQFIMINQGGLEMFGFGTGTKQLSLSFISIFPNPPAEKTVAAWKKTLEGGDSVELLEKVTTSSGRLFWGAIRLEHFLYSGKRYCLVTITDVTQLRKVEETAIREKERFEALFNNSTVGILVTDQSGEIQLANRFLELQFGYDSHELLGKSVEMLIPQELAERHRMHRKKFSANPHARPMGIGLDLFGLKKDGSRFPVEISLSYYTSGLDTFVIAFINDITRRKNNERELLQQQDDLQRYADEVKALNLQLEQRVEERTLVLKETLRQLEKNRQELSEALEKEKELSDLKSRFVAMASHEFRTPLSTILSSAALIEKYPLPEEKEKRLRHINRIRDNVKHLNDILEDFLSLEKLEEGMIHAHPSLVHVQNLLNDLMHDMMEVKKGTQQITYTHQGNPEYPVDQHLLRNVLVNLLSNAVKFSPDDGLIELNSSIQGNELTISVRDYGIGISEDDRHHLFDRFFRGKNAINIKGTGLGLHIVSKYLELLQGKIVCRSALNEGTEFIIQLTTEKLKK